MFDRLGRVMCQECSSVMRSIDVAAGEALFQCCNEQCNHTRVVRWPVPGQERIRIRHDKLKAA
jgi:hypothetical protein